jgi:hypothetical protein
VISFRGHWSIRAPGCGVLGLELFGRSFCLRFSERLSALLETLRGFERLAESLTDISEFVEHCIARRTSLAVFCRIGGVPFAVEVSPVHGVMFERDGAAPLFLSERTGIECCLYSSLMFPFHLEDFPSDELMENSSVFFQHGLTALQRLRQVFSQDEWSCGRPSIRRSTFVIFRRRISVNFHWRPLNCFAVIIPCRSAFSVLRVPLANFQKFYQTSRSVHHVFKIELRELEGFRDAILHFYDDLGLLLTSEFLSPALDDLHDNSIVLRREAMTATLDADGLTIESTAIPLLTNVAERFREIFGGDRRLLRRAAQLLIGIAKFDQSYGLAIAEILHCAQRDSWQALVNWELLFDTAKFSPDRGRIVFALRLPRDSLEFEMGKVAMKLQISVACRAGGNIFSNLRQIIQWMSESDPMTAFVL